MVKGNQAWWWNQGGGAQGIPESGPLHIDGTRFKDDKGNSWQWRGATMFLLGGRSMVGEDITPQINWMRANAINIARVFGPVNWPDAFAAPYQGVPSAQNLDHLFKTLGDAGLRIEYSAITYPWDGSRDFLQTVFEVASSHWNVVVEVTNEPHVNGTDPISLVQGMNRFGVLTAYGLDAEALWNESTGYEIPVLDYSTTHDQARDEAHSPRNTKEAKDQQDTLRVPVVNDEPIGVIDPQKFNFHQTSGSLWERPGGGSVRTTNIDIIRDGAAISSLYTPGYTLHTQAGLEGRAPGQDEPIQHAAAKALSEVWGFVGAQVQEGDYARPGLNWPLTWAPGDGDSLIQHAYASIKGGDAWIVNPMPAPGWGITPVDGWQVKEVGPVPYIAHLIR